MTEAEVLERLRGRYDRREWCFLTHVGNSTGRVRRFADAVAFNLWESRGHALHGFEVKVSRNDWRKELKDPSKAEIIARFCHRWYLVVSDPDIVQAGELPDGWGLLVPRGKGFTEAVTPLQREPEEMPRGFLAQLLRNAQNQAPGVADAQALQDEAVAAARAEEREKASDIRKRYEELVEAVGDFQRAAGFPPLGQSSPGRIRRELIDNAHDLVSRLGWSGTPETIGLAVASIVHREKDDGRLVDDLRGYRNRTARALGTLDEVLAELDPQEDS